MPLYLIPDIPASQKRRQGINRLILLSPMNFWGVSQLQLPDQPTLTMGLFPWATNIYECPMVGRVRRHRNCLSILTSFVSISLITCSTPAHLYRHQVAVFGIPLGPLRPGACLSCPLSVWIGSLSTQPPRWGSQHLMQMNGPYHLQQSYT